MSLLDHPQLGSIRGRQNSGVIDYRGLKYGTLANKFSPAVLFEKTHESDAPTPTRDYPLDATRSGPCVIGGVENCHLEYNLLQHDLPETERLVESDVECLNLNVAVPEGVAQGNDLPVLVFFHGGGLNLGSANWPQNNLVNFVKYSSSIDMPLIVVGVNYRVGPFGFLTSQEMRLAGYSANNGLRDQRTALRWLEKYISGFGGDPEALCVIGQSAGGVSATLQLASEEPLFKRLISLSGTFLAMKPLPASVHESKYQAAIRLLGLDNLESRERIRALESMEASHIIAKLGMAVPAAPMIDGDMCLVEPTFASLIGGIPKTLSRGWCSDIMLGYCQFDGSIFSLALDHRKKEIGKAFASSLNSNLSDLKGAASSILEAYNVNPNREENDQASFLAILRFCQDIVFQAPAVILAKEWVPDAAYLFQFCAPNPWSGPWQGMASHIIDLVHLWQNFDGYLPEAQQRVGKAMGSDLIRFAYGKAPWSTDGQYSSVAKEYGIRDSEEPKYGVAREGPIWDLMDRFGADRVLGAADNFLVGL